MRCDDGNNHPVCSDMTLDYQWCLNLAAHGGFVLKLQHRVLDCAAYLLAECIMSKETKTHVTHSFLWGKTVICFLLRHWGATNHSCDLTTFLYTKTPVNVKNERARTENASFSSCRCTFGPAHMSPNSSQLVSEKHIGSTRADDHLMSVLQLHDPSLPVESGSHGGITLMNPTCALSFSDIVTSLTAF